MVTREQGFLTPQVQTQTADLGQSNLTNQLADFAFQTADVLKQKANHRHELKFKNQAQEEINNIFERNQSDPAQFQKEATAAQRALNKSAPLFMRAEFKELFNTQAKPYLNKATANHERVLTDDIKFATLKRIDLAKQSATFQAGGLFSGDPVQVADSQLALQDLITDATGAASAVDGRGQPVLGAAERFRISKDFIDDVAFSSVRSGYDEAEDKEAYLANFESGELKAAIFVDEQGDFVERSVKDGMDRAVFERTRKYMVSDIKALKLESERQQARQLKLFTEDPAQLAIESGANPNDPDGIIEMQRNLGITEGNISIVPKQNAAEAVNQMNGITDADSMIAALSEIEQTYGSENYNMAMKDLKKAGLSDQMSFIAMMNPQEDKQLMDASFAMGLAGDDIKKKATARIGVTTAKISDRVAENIVDTLEAISFENPTGQAQTAAMQANMTGIATFFVAQGMDIDDATKRATEWFNNKINLGDVNNKKFRIADGFTADELEPALEQALRDTTFQGGEFENAVIRREARFVLHPDGTRYYIKNGINAIVQDETGVVYFPITDILESRKATKKARREELAQQQLEKLQSE